MNKKILIVEDTPDLLQTLSEYLVMEGFTVFPCLRAKLALDKLEQGDMPDLILTDLSMPDMDGFQLIEIVRQTKLYEHLPVVIFSARPIHENQARAASLGVARYIKKPCAPDELVMAIREILKDK